MHPVLILTNYTNCKNVLLELSLNATTETPSAVMFKKLEQLTIYNRINYFRAVIRGGFRGGVRGVRPPPLPP